MDITKIEDGYETHQFEHFKKTMLQNFLNPILLNENKFMIKQWNGCQ